VFRYQAIVRWSPALGVGCVTRTRTGVGYPAGVTES